VAVHDGVAPGESGLTGGHRPRIRHATSGRGLAMVSRLSQDWGVRAEEQGKAVWAIVSVNEGAPGGTYGAIGGGELAHLS
ncbi:MAG TPA: hypothetical protein VED59_01165, partial [Acidimicrobiales bacterium]|nr:hypothetical protein [Acidimicrobiales bacterium]